MLEDTNSILDRKDPFDPWHIAANRVKCTKFMTKWILLKMKINWQGRIYLDYFQFQPVEVTIVTSSKEKERDKVMREGEEREREA